MKSFSLKKQLYRQGADRKEAQNLTYVADQLKNSVPGLGAGVKKQIAQEVGFKPARVVINLRYTAAAVSMLLVVLVVVAQSAQPGSVLYALKRGSEEVRVILQPGFDDDDLQKRRNDEQQQSQTSDSSEDNHDEQTEDRSLSDDALDESEDFSGDDHSTVEPRSNENLESSSEIENVEDGSSTDNSGSGSSHDSSLDD